MKISKILQFIFHIIMVLCDLVILILMLNCSEPLIRCFALSIILTSITVALPDVKSFYIRLLQSWFCSINPVEEMMGNESKENHMKSDEISDETIMKVLNAIGYEEKSWIAFVRKQLNKNNE